MSTGYEPLLLKPVHAFMIWARCCHGDESTRNNRLAGVFGKLYCPFVPFVMGVGDSFIVGTYRVTVLGGNKQTHRKKPCVRDSIRDSSHRCSNGQNLEQETIYLLCVLVFYILHDNGSPATIGQEFSSALLDIIPSALAPIRCSYQERVLISQTVTYHFCVVRFGSPALSYISPFS